MALKLKALFASVLLVLLLLGGLGVWGLMNHYETKLANQSIDHAAELEKRRQIAEETFNRRVEQAERTEHEYKTKVTELESKVRTLDSLNSELDSTIIGLRKSERDLRTRFDKLSAEAKREYAVGATEAFREVSEALAIEQRAHQETSAEAERYWLGWDALDKSWDLPVETKVKEVGDGQ